MAQESPSTDSLPEEGLPGLAKVPTRSCAFSGSAGKGTSLLQSAPPWKDLVSEYPPCLVCEAEMIMATLLKKRFSLRHTTSKKTRLLPQAA